MPRARANDRDSRLIYDVCERFFTAARLFQSQYEHYEARVLEYARTRGVDRRQLRLDSREVASLLDFRALEELRDRTLFALKEHTHALFRRTGATDPFDRYISDIFHEISILKEEHYQVGTYGAQYEQTQETEEAHVILDEVHEAFPRRVQTVKRLIQKAQGRLLAVLPDYRTNGILVRSIAMYGDDLVAGVLPDGAAGLFAAMFPDGGAVAGFCDAARRFHAAGFTEWATRSLASAEAVLAALAAGAPGQPAAARAVAELRDALRTAPEATAEPASPQPARL